jgi:hypothetical protein
MNLMAVGALAPAVVVAPEALLGTATPSVLTTDTMTLNGLRGAGISLLAGGAVDVGRQLWFTPAHRPTDPGAVLNAAVNSGVSGLASTVGGRVWGTPGAAAGAFVGAKATGANDLEAALAAGGAVYGRLAIPDRNGEKIGAALMRQGVRSLLTKSVTGPTAFALQNRSSRAAR